MSQLSEVAASTLYWLQWMAICVISTEAATEIIVDSKLFGPLRNKIGNMAYPKDMPPQDTRNSRLIIWFHSLVTCGYCLSVWVSGLFVLLMPGYPSVLIDSRRSPQWYWMFCDIILIIATWLAYLLVAHRVANWLHVRYKLLERGRVVAHDYTIKSVNEEVVS